MADNNSPQTGKRLKQDGTVVYTIDNGLPVITIEHEYIHRKIYYDFTKRFADVADDGVAYVSVRPQTKDAHIVITISPGGDAYFDTYKDTTWTADGTEGTPFNRYVDDAPAADVDVYYGGTPDTLGTHRAEIFIPGGSGPLSSGNIGGVKTETVLEAGTEMTIAVQNKAGGVKDIGIIVEWYELD